MLIPIVIISQNHHLRQMEGRISTRLPMRMKKINQFSKVWLIFAKYYLKKTQSSSILRMKWQVWNHQHYNSRNLFLRIPRTAKNTSKNRTVVLYAATDIRFIKLKHIFWKKTSIQIEVSAEKIMQGPKRIY